MKEHFGTLLTILIKTYLRSEKAAYLLKDEKTPRSSVTINRIGKQNLIVTIMGNDETDKHIS